MESWIQGVIVSLFFLIGLVYCFAGNRALRFTLGVTGFLAGGFFAAVVVCWLPDEMERAGIICFFLGGGASAFIVVRFRNFGVFCQGFIGSALASSIIADLLFGDAATEWGGVILLISGLAGGVLGLYLERPVMSVATAVIGAYMTTYIGAGIIAPPPECCEDPLDNPRISAAMLVFGTALALAGVHFQLAVLKPTAEQRAWPPGPAWNWIRRIRRAVGR